MAIPPNFSATNAADNIEARWWIDIEGIRVRFGSWVPSWSPADSGTNRPIKDYLVDMVQFDPGEVDPLDGGARSGGFSVELLDVDDELTDLFGVANRDAVALLTVALSAGGATITVDDSSVFAYPGPLYLDNETVWALSAPTGTTINVTGGRGMFGSADVDHLLTDAQGNPRSVEVRDTPPHILTREVKLYESREALVEADAIVVRGTLEELSESQGVWTLRCSGPLRRLQVTIGETLARTKLSHPLWGGTFDDEELAGWKDRKGNNLYSDWCAMVVDLSSFQTTGVIAIDDELVFYSGVEDNTWPTYSWFEINHDGTGQVTSPLDLYHSTANRGLLSTDILGPSDGVRVILQTQNPSDVINQIVAPAFMDWHQRWAEVREVISWHWLSPDFPLGASGAYARLDPITVALSLMTSTGEGTNGDYDCLPRGWGAGIPEDYIDIAGWEELRDRYGLGSYEMKFFIDGPVDLGEWLQENVFRPCLLFPTETLDGKIGVARLMSKNEAAQESGVLELDEDVLIEIPRLEPAQLPFGEFTFRMNHLPTTDEFYGNVRVILGHGLEKYKSMAKRFEVDCRSFYDWRFTDGLGGGGETFSPGSLGEFPAILRQYIQPIAHRFSENPCPVYRARVPYNRWTQVQPGAIVQLTCSVLPNPKTGLRGITSEFCQVISCKPSPRASSLELTLWQIGVHDDNYKRRAPSCRIDSWDSRENLIVVDPVWTDEDDALFFEAGDFIQLVQEDYSPCGARTTPEICEIDAVDINEIFLTGAPSTAPSSGDWVDTAPYDSCTAGQKSRWAFLADTNGQLGAANDEADVRL